MAEPILQVSVPQVLWVRRARRFLVSVGDSAAVRFEPGLLQLLMYPIGMNRQRMLIG